MAVDHNSLGTAISLQGQPKMYEGLFAHGIERNAAQKDALARQKAAKEDDSNKRLQAILDKDFKVDPSRYHPLYMDKVNGTLKNTFNEILETRRQNPDNWGNIILPKLFDMTQKLNFYQQQSGIAKTIEKDAFEGKHYSDASFLKSANDPASAKDWSKVQTDPNSVYGTAFDPTSGAITYNPVQKYDLSGAVDKFKKDANNWTDISISSKKVLGAAPDRFATTTRKVIKGDAFDGLNAAVTTNPVAIGDYVARHAEDYNQAVKSGTIKDPQSRSDWALKGLNFELSQGVGNGTDRIKDFTDRRPQPKAAKAKVDLNQGLDAMLSQGRLNQNEQMTISTGKAQHAPKTDDDYAKMKADLSSNPAFKKFNDADKSTAIDRIIESQKKLDNVVVKNTTMATAKYSLPVKSTTSTIVTGSPDMMDLSSNHDIKDRAQFNFLPGGIKVVSIKGKWVPMVYGQATDKAVDENNKEYNVTGDIAVPLSTVEDFLNSKPYETPTKWAYEGAQRENSKGSSAPATSAAKPSAPAQVSEVSRVDKKSGKTAIFDANTKKFLRWQ